MKGLLWYPRLLYCQTMSAVSPLVSMYRAAIEAVSPLSLVARAVKFDAHSCILKVDDRSYTLNKLVGKFNVLV